MIEEPAAPLTTANRIDGFDRRRLDEFVAEPLVTLHTVVMLDEPRNRPS
jgi:hypothetical protein